MRRSRWTRRTWPTSWSGSAAAFPSSASSSSLSPLVIGSYQWHFYGQEHLSISVLFNSNSFPLSFILLSLSHLQYVPHVTLSSLILIDWHFVCMILKRQEMKNLASFNLRYISLIFKIEHARESSFWRQEIFLKISQQG